MMVKDTHMVNGKRLCATRHGGDGIRFGGDKEEQVAISQARCVADGFLAEARKADGATQGRE